MNFVTPHYSFCTIFGNEKSAIIVDLRLQNATMYHIWRFIFTSYVGFPFHVVIYIVDTYFVNKYK